MRITLVHSLKRMFWVDLIGVFVGASQLGVEPAPGKDNPLSSHLSASETDRKCLPK